MVSTKLAVKNSGKLVGWLFLFSAISFIAIFATSKIKANVMSAYKELTK